MQDFTRYAVYYAPQPGIFADRTAAWLGWDLAHGRAVDDPALPARWPPTGPRWNAARWRCAIWTGSWR
jgi:hypothetical protein